VIERLRPGGRLVANFVVLDNLMMCQSQMEAAGLRTSVAQISASRLGARHRLQALNPVFVLSAVKGGASARTYQ
jgi:precorrin-6Y C5,15-methyltransferase (decarboxylating)